MTSPFVSIIIPCYNAAPWVGEAIGSALAQTYLNKEVIVIDDGSTDGSLQVIRSFRDRIRWETGANRGACAARNKGLRLAKGELIQFLDADDLLYVTKVEKQVAVRDTVSADIVFCDGEVLIDGRREPWAKHIPPYSGGDIFPFVLRHQMAISAPLHQKRLLESIGGFDESLPCAQEFDLNIRLACAGVTFHHFREILYIWRRPQNRNTVSSNHIRVLDQYEKILSSAHTALRLNGGPTEAHAEALAEAFASAARYYIRHKEEGKGRRYLGLARGIHKSGGLMAFGRLYRTANRLFGPIVTEYMVDVKRWLLTCFSGESMKGIAASNEADETSGARDL